MINHLTIQLAQMINKAEKQPAEEDEEEDKEEEETAESWLCRHLLATIACDKSAIDTLLTDSAPLIHLITSPEDCRALFMTVRKNKVFAKEAPLPTVHFDVEKVEKNAERKHRTSKKVNKNKHMKSSNKKKQTNSRSRSKSKSTSPRKKTSEVNTKKLSERKKRNEEEIEKEKALADQLAQAQLEREMQQALPQMPETVLSWHMEKSLPKVDQYFFIVNKSNVSENTTYLDDIFHVGYVNNNRFLKAALSTAAVILEKKLSFEMTVDMLLSFHGVEERKVPKELKLETFILDCIIRHFCIETKIRLDNTESRSIQALLQPVMYRFCSNSLSFFDIDLLNEETPIQQCADRLTMALGTLQILSFLFSETVLDWCRKTFTHLIDVFSTVLAKHVVRKCEILVNFEKTKIYPICASFQETVNTIRELSEILFDAVDDQAPIEKMVFSFDVVVVLEEDIDEILLKVEDLHCEKRDTAIERSGIREAHLVLQQLNEYLEENCMESAVESSNLDSLKTLARNLSSFEKRLNGIMATLPE